MNVKTTQGEFEVCDCGNPDGHVGPVWHPGHEHPSGAKLAKGEDAKLALVEGQLHARADVLQAQADALRAAAKKVAR